MFLIPYRTLELRSALVASAFAARLRQVTVPQQRRFGALPPEISFVGAVGTDTFRLAPATRGLNTYQPWLRGRMVPTATGTAVTVTATLHPVAIVAMLAFVIWPQYLAVTAEGGLNYLWLGVMGAFHAGMCGIGFWPELRKAERQLRHLAAETQDASGQENHARAGRQPKPDSPDAI